jgi:hypothetical protein
MPTGFLLLLQRLEGDFLLSLYILRHSYAAALLFFFFYFFFSRDNYSLREGISDVNTTREQG